MPTHLKDVDYSKIKRVIWLRSVVPQSATDITGWYTRGSCTLRFGIKRKDFEKWIKSVNDRPPDGSGVIVLTTDEHVMGDNGESIEYGTVIENGQKWVELSNRGTVEWLVIYEPDLEVARLTISSE